MPAAVEVVPPALRAMEGEALVKEAVACRVAHTATQKALEVALCKVAYAAAQTECRQEAARLTAKHEEEETARKGDEEKLRVAAKARASQELAALQQEKLTDQHAAAQLLAACKEAHVTALSESARCEAQARDTVAALQKMLAAQHAEAATPPSEGAGLSETMRGEGLAQDQTGAARACAGAAPGRSDMKALLDKASEELSITVHHRYRGMVMSLVLKQAHKDHNAELFADITRKLITDKYSSFGVYPDAMAEHLLTQVRDDARVLAAIIPSTADQLEWCQSHSEEFREWRKCLKGKGSLVAIPASMSQKLRDTWRLLGDQQGFICVDTDVESVWVVANAAGEFPWPKGSAPHGVSYVLKHVREMVMAQANGATLAGTVPLAHCDCDGNVTAHGPIKVTFEMAACEGAPMRLWARGFVMGTKQQPFLAGVSHTVCMEPLVRRRPSPRLNPPRKVQAHFYLKVTVQFAGTL